MHLPKGNETGHAETQNSSGSEGNERPGDSFPSESYNWDVLISKEGAYDRRTAFNQTRRSDPLAEMMRMYDSQEHIFTNEFDEICIVISLDMGITSASVQVTILEPNGIWDERLPISMDNSDHRSTR
jgi:hypothetical protein